MSSTAHVTAAATFYDVFGRFQSYPADGPGYTSTYYNPVGFGGQFGYYRDYTDRTLLGHRYYDSFTGRFLNRDPIGYKGGINPYDSDAKDERKINIVLRPSL